MPQEARSLRVLVIDDRKNVVKGEVAAHALELIAETAEESLPADMRGASQNRRARIIGEHMRRFMVEGHDGDRLAVAQAVVALAVLYGFRIHDDDGDAYLRVRIDTMLVVDGDDPVLAIGVLENAIVAAVTNNPEDAQAQLSALVSKIKIGERGTVIVGGPTRH